MPKPLRIASVPNAIRAALDTKLRDNGYSDFIALSEWLKEQGHQVGKSSIGRYAERLRAIDAVDRVGMAAVLDLVSTPASRLRLARRPKVMAKNANIDRLINALNPAERRLVDTFRKLSDPAQLKALQKLDSQAADQRNLRR